MPTKHRRINVTCDSELEAALAAAAPHVGAKSDAGRLRELALKGARAVASESGDESLDALLAMKGVQRARTTDKRLPWFDEFDGEPTTAGTDALAWVRGHDRDY